MKMCGSSCKCKECKVDWRDFIRKDNPFLKARNNMNWKFETEDFEAYSFYAAYCAKLCNDKITKWLKDAKMVYGRVAYMGIDGKVEGSVFEQCDKPYQTHKALLINIEPIYQCKHEASTVHKTYSSPNPYFPKDEHIPEFIGYECSCGARVTPSGFEVVK